MVLQVMACDQSSRFLPGREAGLVAGAEVNNRRPFTSVFRKRLLAVVSCTDHMETRHPSKWAGVWLANELGVVAATGMFQHQYIQETHQELPGLRIHLEDNPLNICD